MRLRIATALCGFGLILAGALTGTTGCTGSSHNTSTTTSSPAIRRAAPATADRTDCPSVYAGETNAGNFCTLIDPPYYAQSKPLDAMSVGDTEFAVLSLPEPTGYVDGVVRDPAGHLCLSPTLRVWTTPGLSLMSDGVAYDDFAIKRTGLTEYTVITRPNYNPSDPQHGELSDIRSNCQTTMTVTDSLPTRTVLGWLPDYAIGQSGYVLAKDVWAPKDEPNTGYVIADTTSPKSFPGAVKVTRQATGYTIQWSANFYLVDPGQNVADLTRVTFLS